MENELKKIEYAEVSNSLRHLNDIRLKMVQFCITINGFCLAFFATLSTSVSSGFWSQFSFGAEEEADLGPMLFSDPSNLIAVLAIFVTLLSLSVEFLSSRQFEILSERGGALEREFGIEGQYHLSLEMQKSRRGVSVMASGIAFYLLIVAFWLFLALG